MQVDEDEPLFLSLISDLFPGIQLDSSTYADLQAAVEHQVQLAGIINHPPWNLKLVQVPLISLINKLSSISNTQLLKINLILCRTEPIC